MTSQKLKKRENIGIETYLIEKIDELVQQRVFTNRAQAANYMIRKYLEDYETTDIEILKADLERMKRRLAELERDQKNI